MCSHVIRYQQPCSAPTRQKSGAWALIHVLEGKLRYYTELPPSESILEAAKPAVIGASGSAPCETKSDLHASTLNYIKLRCARRHWMWKTSWRDLG